METKSPENLDFYKVLTAFRSLSNEGNISENDISEAKDNYKAGKEEITQNSHLELSGLESVQTYSSAVTSSLDLINTINLRRDWSHYIKYGFYAMVGLQVSIIPILLTLMFFRPDVTFEKITTIIYVVIGENFVQIIGVVLVVVKFLFPPETPKVKVE